nr:BLADE-ON-PETIOLE [Cymbidium ensifolium]
MAEESFKSLSMDYLNLLINGQAFSDVTFSVEGRLVHAHRCILASRSPFFRRFFDSPPANLHRRSNSSLRSSSGLVIPVNSVSYEVFLLVLQFLYSGQVSLIPPKHEQRPNCAERGCWHTHCASAIDLALDTLAAARSFGVEELVFLTQKQLENMVDKASIEDTMRVLLASRKQEMHQLWNTCSHLVAKSGLPPEVLAKHLPIDIVAKIEELRIESSFSRRPSFLHNHHLPLDIAVAVPKPDDYHHKIRRMRRALDSSDVELVKLMVMGEGLNLDEALALHYAVQNCSREVVKALLELGAADVNLQAGPTGKTPLHLASEMVCPDMVAVLLDHHADPNIRTTDDITPLDILRSLTSDFLFKGALPGLSHIEPNKLRLCLELVQSAVMVLSREEAAAANGNSNNAGGSIYHPLMSVESGDIGNENVDSNLSLDSKMVYLNLGMAAVGRLECDGSRNRSQGNSGGIGLSSIYSQHDHFP